MRVFAISILKFGQLQLQHRLGLAVPAPDAMNTLLQQNALLMQQLTVSAGMRNYHILPDLSKTIKTFSGDETGPAAREWLESVKSAALLHNWPEAFTFETAHTHLMGASKHWFEGRRREINNWRDFETSFSRTFIHTENLTQLWKQMNSRVRENVSNYFHEKVKLCRRLHLSFDETKEQVVIGLASRELSSMIMARYHADVDQLFQDILSYERVSSERSQRHRNVIFSRVG